MKKLESKMSTPQQNQSPIHPTTPLLTDTVAIPPPVQPIFPKDQIQKGWAFNNGTGAFFDFNPSSAALYMKDMVFPIVHADVFLLKNGISKCLHFRNNRAIDSTGFLTGNGSGLFYGQPELLDENGEQVTDAVNLYAIDGVGVDLYDASYQNVYSLANLYVQTRDFGIVITMSNPNGTPSIHSYMTHNPELMAILRDLTYVPAYLLRKYNPNSFTAYNNENGGYNNV